ncbi:MAG: hypothetical protein WAR37_01785 [Candidatus Microsaccharimonas sp.]
MNYIEHIKHERGFVTSDVHIPSEVFSYGLSFKQPEQLDRLPTPEDLLGEPFENQQYMKARRIGNQLLSLTVISYLASLNHGESLYLGNLSPEAQAAAIEDTITPGANGRLPGLCITDGEIRRRLAETKRESRFASSSFLKRIASYADIRVGAFPPNDWPIAPFGNQDVMLTQAFGRNMYEDSELPLIGAKRHELGGDEETFGWLNQQGFEAGISNEALADIIATQLEDPTSIVEQVVQWEVAYVLWKRYPDVFRRHRAGISIVWPRDGAKSYRTFEVKSDSKDVMIKNGLYNPFELAHPDMVIRALAILDKLDIPADAYLAGIPFNKDSTQFQTRNKVNWQIWEALVRSEHVLRSRVKL